ncbi:hypothetical protein Aperf_G00000005403 [Anoplocephala perfoliata]
MKGPTKALEDWSSFYKNFSGSCNVRSRSYTETTMNSLDKNSSEKVLMKNRFSSSAKGSIKENGIGEPPAKRRKTLRYSQEAEAVECEVSVHEIYQLGFEDKENKETYIFNNIDSLEVSYEASVSNTDLSKLESPAMFSPDPELDRQLSETASIALEELSSPLETILDATEEQALMNFTSRHLSYDDELRVLRLQTFNLLRLIIPNPKLEDGFDSSTADLDRFVLRIIKYLKGDHDSTGNDNSSEPLKVCSVVLAADYPLKVLRNRVLTLLKLLLPKFRLPDSFDLKRDLQDLINSVYTYNKF